MNGQALLGDISSVADDSLILGVNYNDIPEEDPGPVIDSELVGEEGEKKDKPLVRETRPTKKNARGTAPTAIEWQDWFSNVLIRYATDYYLSFAFRGIDEDIVSERDLNRINLSKEERHRIAEPLAEFASKSSIGKKYGRTLISTTGSLESLVTLGMWASRVSRIARKYRPERTKKNVNSRQTESEPPFGTDERPITIIPGRG